MDDYWRLPASVLEAATDRKAGASEIAQLAIDGLLAVADDPALLEAAVHALLTGQPAMAPLWHIAQAARSPRPRMALIELGRRLDAETDAAVETAVGWLRRHPGPVRTVSHSSLVQRALERLGPGTNHVQPVAAVLGADAIGPTELLNATGSRALAGELPTLVVVTSIKLVPRDVFERLAGPGFERIPLDEVEAVALGANLLSPAEAGERAAATARVESG